MEDSRPMDGPEVDDRCRPASPDSVTASWVPGQLAIRVKGTFPEDCWEADIHQSEIDVWPPEFRVEECRVGDICNQIMTPYDVESNFEMNTPPDSIRVHIEGQTLEVQVDVQPDASSNPGAGSNYSSELSLDEAFRRAVEQLPPPEPPTAGRQFNVRITYDEGDFAAPQIIVHLEPM